MNPNKLESRLIDLLQRNYLDEDQIDYLVDEYTSKVKQINGSFIDDGILLERNFRLEVAFYWAAEELKHREFYRNFVRQMLVKENFMDLMRDCVILELRRRLNDLSK